MKTTMYIYRPHKGSLADAMKEARTFASKNDMFRHIVNEWNRNGVDMLTTEDLSLSEIIGDDKRVLWEDCRYVLTKRLGSVTFDCPQCVGTCAELPTQSDFDLLTEDGERRIHEHCICPCQHG